MQPFHPTSDSVRQAGQRQFTATQGAVLIQAGVVGWILIRCHRDYFRTLPATWAYCCGDFWIGQEPSSSIVSQDWYKSAKHVQNSLAEEFIYLLPNRPPFLLRPLLCRQVREIQVSPSRMQIHVPSPHNLRFEPELVDNIEGDNNRRRKVGLEKVID